MKYPKPDQTIARDAARKLYEGAIDMLSLKIRLDLKDTGQISPTTVDEIMIFYSDAKEKQILPIPECFKDFLTSIALRVDVFFLWNKEKMNFQRVYAMLLNEYEKIKMFCN